MWRPLQRRSGNKNRSEEARLEKKQSPHFTALCLDTAAAECSCCLFVFIHLVKNEQKKILQERGHNVAVSNYNMTELLVKTRCNISGKNSKRFASMLCTVGGGGRDTVSPKQVVHQGPRGKKGQ